MNPQISKATAPMYRNSRSQPPWIRFFALLACLTGISNALFTGNPIMAFQVPDDRIKVDGSPDTLWKAIYDLEGGSVIDFQDYNKIVVLNDPNRDPSQLIPPPAGDSIFMLAAYDSKALYFYFQAKVATVAKSNTLCASAETQWKADAAEVFVDPSPWSQDTAVYRSYFSADAGGLAYGTSPKTIQFDKPLYDKETRSPYFRSRVNGDKFQIPATLPTGVQAASLRYRKDSTRVSVEMRIPFWGGSAAAFAPGKSMFISWGFNMYPDSLWNRSCATADPIAFRWAKNTLNYDDASTKPPGWRMNDSTHYDPLRSWDGWGRLTLSNEFVDTRTCQFSDTSSWLPADWDNSKCRQQTTELGDRARASGHRAGGFFNTGSAQGRDLRGRATQNHSPKYRLPWETLRAAQTPGKP
jgi:hypothetical protein